MSSHTDARASEQWPIPIDFDALKGHTRQRSRIVRAALSEVGVPIAEDPAGPRRRRHASRQHQAEILRAQALSFEAFGIEYEMVDEDEYRSRVVARFTPDGGVPVIHQRWWWT